MVSSVWRQAHRPAILLPQPAGAGFTGVHHHLGNALMLSCPDFWDLKHHLPVIYTPEFSPQSLQLMRKYPNKLPNLPTSDSPNGFCAPKFNEQPTLAPILLGPHSTSLCSKVGKSSHTPYFRHLKLSLKVSKHPNSHKKKKPPLGCLLQTLHQLSELLVPSEDITMPKF